MLFCNIHHQQAGRALPGAQWVCFMKPGAALNLEKCTFLFPLIHSYLFILFPFPHFLPFNNKHIIDILFPPWQKQKQKQKISMYCHPYEYFSVFLSISLWVYFVVYHWECVCVCVCCGFSIGLLSSKLNWKQVWHKDLITFAAHYPVTVCTYLPLCVLINQAETTLSAPLHFSTWLATSNSRAQQRDETTCCCLLFQHLQCKRL